MHYFEVNNTAPNSYGVSHRLLTAGPCLKGHLVCFPMHVRRISSSKRRVRQADSVEQHLLVSTVRQVGDEAEAVDVESFVCLSIAAAMRSGSTCAGCGAACRRYSPDRSETGPTKLTRARDWKDSLGHLAYV